MATEFTTTLQRDGQDLEVLVRITASEADGSVGGFDVFDGDGREVRTTHAENGVLVDEAMEHLRNLEVHLW